LRPLSFAATTNGTAKLDQLAEKCAVAGFMRDDWARRTMERLALSYERLAAHAAKREADEVAARIRNWAA